MHLIQVNFQAKKQIKVLFDFSSRFFIQGYQVIYLVRKIWFALAFYFRRALSVHDRDALNYDAVRPFQVILVQEWEQADGVHEDQRFQYELVCEGPEAFEKNLKLIQG